MKKCFVGVLLGCSLLGTAWGQDGDGDFDEFAGEFGDADSSSVSDPLSAFNRAMFVFNDKLYFLVLKPVGLGYGRVVPEPVRAAVSRCFRNLLFPVRVVNTALQGKFRAAQTECARFGVNSTLGVLGLFDPARTKYGMEPTVEDFGQTLGHYGVGAGVPVTLPLLGPSNMRDIVGMVPDYFLDPVSYINSTKIRWGVGGCHAVNHVSLHVGEYESIKHDALDPYTFIRDAYRQNREKKIQE